MLKEINPTHYISFLRHNFDSKGIYLAYLATIVLLVFAYSQNTIFLYDALWATLIPITTAFRVCDIWRGYWTQRLLWDIGGRLAFTPPSVVQYRNAHRSFADFLDESDLYKQGGRLVEFLGAWRPPPKATLLQDRMKELAHDMVVEGFWGQGDADLISMWVDDLHAVGYKFPVPTEQAPNEVLAPTVGVPKSWRLHSDITIIVMFSKPNGATAEIASLLHTHYSFIVGRVIFTGNFSIQQLNIDAYVLKM